MAVATVVELCIEAYRRPVLLGAVLKAQPAGAFGAVTAEDEGRLSVEVKRRQCQQCVRSAQCVSDLTCWSSRLVGIISDMRSVPG